MNTPLNPVLSIIITTIDPSLYIERLLLSLANYSLDTIELIVVNQHSNSVATQTNVQSIKFNEVRPEGKLSAPNARNFGAKYSSGKYLIFLDDDCVLLGEQKYLDGLLELLRSNYTKLILLKPFSLTKDESFGAWDEKECIKFNYYNLYKFYIEWNTVIEKKLFDSIGGFYDIGPGSGHAAQAGEITILIYKALSKKFSISAFKDLSVGHGHSAKIDTNLKKISYQYGIGYSTGTIVQYLPLWHMPIFVCSNLLRPIAEIVIYGIKFYCSKDPGCKKKLNFNIVKLNSFLHGLLKRQPSDISYIESHV